MGAGPRYPTGKGAREGCLGGAKYTGRSRVGYYSEATRSRRVGALRAGAGGGARYVVPGILQTLTRHGLASFRKA